PSEKGYMWSQYPEPCATTDCAVAVLEPGVKFHNVWNTPKGPIAITGVNTAVTDIENTAKILGPPAGKSPTDEQYVRIFTPREGGKLIYGTVVYKIAEAGFGVHLAEETPGDQYVTPIYKDKGLTASNMLLPYVNQIAILPRP